MSFGAEKRAARLLALWIGIGGVVAHFVIGYLAWWLWTPLAWLFLPLYPCLYWAVWVYPVRWAAGYGGELDASQLYIHRGVLWRREWLLPLSALRSVEWWEPPLHRLFGCRTLLLRHTGGTVLLPLLPRGQAAALWKRLEALA